MAYIFRFNLPLNSLSIKSYFQLHSQTFKPFTCTKGILWSYVYSCDKIVYFCPQCYIQPSGIEIILQKLCKGNLVISFEIWDLLTLSLDILLISYLLLSFCSSFLYSCWNIYLFSPYI